MTAEIIESHEAYLYNNKTINITRQGYKALNVHYSI